MDTRQVSKYFLRQCCASFAGASVLLGCVILAQAEELSQGFEGDVGLGGYYTRSIIRGIRDDLSVLPYADFEYGRLFARVDTVGIKTQKLGYGHLELVGRISQDGFGTNMPNLRGLANRETPIPLGIGTLQVTPLGGIMINAFHDVHRSKGNLFEVFYVAEVDLPQVNFYPLLGAEYQSREYVRYLYGISAQEAAESQFAAYAPGGAFNNFIGLIADIDLTRGYHLNCYARRKWLGDAIQQSPLVNQRYLDIGYVALSYRFK